jgi:haloalkane dehalogenase
MINTRMPYTKKNCSVLGQQMAYVEVGQGDPIVFLHGNATSSYLWRNILPYVEHQARCIAPDLLGMGDSAKLANSGPGAYSFPLKTWYERQKISLLRSEPSLSIVQMM